MYHAYDTSLPHMHADERDARYNLYTQDDVESQAHTSRHSRTDPTFLLESALVSFVACCVLSDIYPLACA